METNNAGNTGVIHSIDNGVEEFITPLLGTSMAGTQYGGIVRPGVMVLRKEGITEEDRKKFAEMCAAEAKWDDIDKALGPVTAPERLKGKSKLVPLNVDFFTINKRDCLNPDNAALTMEKYADRDGKLRSIPVWFPINDWWELIPHSLTSFGKTQGIKHKSSFVPVKDSLGRVTEVKRVCETPEHVERGRRIFGGRSWTQKDCDPDNCQEYQDGNCKLRGRIQFMIPGLCGGDMWVIPTTSFYSLSAIKQTLTRVYEVTNGRIANIIYRGNTIFTLRKRLATVPTIDYDTGEPKLRKQYLINLDLNIDLFELAKMYETRNILARGRQAADILTDGANVVDISERVRQSRVEDTDEKQDSLVPHQDTGAPKESDGASAASEKAPEERPASGDPGGQQDGDRKEPPLSDQIAAIKKLCASFQIPADFAEREIADLDTRGKAAVVIKELNKGDLSRFLPK